ncbi:unnamed protein product, partial [Rotaria sordida]
LKKFVIPNLIKTSTLSDKYDATKHEQQITI